MRSSPRPNRINIDLQGFKQPWLDYCKARGVTPSQAFRQIVAKLTAAESERPSSDGAPHARTAKIRKEVRLTKGELHLAEAIAKREGFSLGRWIVALINARLDGTPQLGQEELEGLARSNMQMLAIGRNLNQLARAANQGRPLLGPVRSPLIEDIQALIHQHTGQVARVITANISRWRH
jgi:hypothetical protein